MKDSKGLVSGLVLLLFGLVCGLLLSVVNGITEDRIAAEELRLKFDVIRDFYNIDQFVLEELDIDNGSIYVLKKDDTIEHLVYSLRAKGYGDDVEMLVAVNKDLSVEGYKVTFQNESPGIGTKILDYDFNYTDASNIGSFDSISGATVSSMAVKEIFEQVAARVKEDFGVTGNGLTGTIDDYYDTSQFNVEEVTIDKGKVFVLKNKTDNTIEHLIYLLAAEGYGDDVEMLVAINKDLSVEGYQVTYQKETANLGDKIVDHDFNYNQANDLSTFDSIGGSTVSSDAVKTIFTEIADRVEADFGGGLDE